LQSKGYQYILDPGVLGFYSKYLTNSVLEIGAGTGCYTQALRRSGLRVDAYEGASNIEELTGGSIKQADLTRNFRATPRDWVVCTEVGEHIPREHEAAVFDALANHAKIGMIISWAVPGQGGASACGPCGHPRAGACPHA
jgi:2-polyprenyl-3-methyl-5-hydroxy-6-metoxy-1,4-benzoquinol methylase